MSEIFKRYSIYYIFLFCFFIGSFMGLRVRSYAADLPSGSYSVQIKYVNTIGTGVNANKYRYSDTIYGFHVNDDSRRFCLVRSNTQAPSGFTYFDYLLISNKQDSVYYSLNQYNYGFNGDIESTYDSNETYNFVQNSLNGYVYYRTPSLSHTYSGYDFSSNMRVFDNLSDAVNYVSTGQLPLLPFDDTLELDELKVTSWKLGTSQALFDSSFKVSWSDSRISLVQVIIDGNARKDSFESSSSPFKQKFNPGRYVMKKGDVVHITATPYKSDGSYGVSLYQTFIFDDNVPGSNIYRKFTNTPYSDNTLTIPYTGISGQPESITVPVDGIATNNTYKVNYNPVTYEYGDMNLYEIYYSPVVIYPSDTSVEEIEETQDVINNSYTTNNYYETTKEINYNFDINFGDISGSDIQQGYDDTGNFLNGFGLFISKLSSWVLLLFPFLPPIVATAIVFIFGLLAFVAIIAFVLKIGSVIADFIDAILPL